MHRAFPQTCSISYFNADTLSESFHKPRNLKCRIHGEHFHTSWNHTPCHSGHLPYRSPLQPEKRPVYFGMNVPPSGTLVSLLPPAPTLTRLPQFLTAQLYFLVYGAQIVMVGIQVAGWYVKPILPVRRVASSLAAHTHSTTRYATLLFQHRAISGQIFSIPSHCSFKRQHEVRDPQAASHTHTHTHTHTRVLSTRVLKK